MSGRFARSAGVVAAAAGVVLLALVVAAVWVVRSDTANRWLCDHIAERLGPRVHFAAAHVLWWPRPGLLLDDVAIDPRPDDPATSTLAAARLTCRVRLSSLARGEVVVAAVRIDGLRLSAVVAPTPARGDPVRDMLEWIRDNAPAGPMPLLRVHDGEIVLRMDGGAGSPGTGGTERRAVRAHVVDAQLAPDGPGARLELAAQVQPRGSVEARAALSSLAEPDAATLTVSVDAAQLDAAAVAAWLPPQLGDLSATGVMRLSASASRDGTAPLAGDVALELADGALTGSEWRIEGPLRLTGQPAWNGSTITVTDAKLEAGRIGAAGVSADAVVASLAYGDGALRIPAVALRAYGGTWRGAGRIVMATPAAADGTLTAADVDASALGAVLAAHGIAVILPSCAAPLQLSATGSGTVGGPWTARADITTDGAVAWQQGRAEGPVQITADLLGSGAMVRSATGSGRARRLAVSALIADDVESAFEYEEGALRLTPLHADAFGGTWTYRGTVPVDGARSWSGELSAERVDTAALSAAAGGVLAAAAPRGSVDATARIDGAGTVAMSATATVRLASDVFAIGDAVSIGQPAQIDATIQYHDGQLRFTDGRLHAHRVQHGGLTADAVAVSFTAKPGGALQIASANATAFGGRWQASGATALSGPRHWNGTVQATHVDFDALLAATKLLDDQAPHSHGGLADIDLQVRQVANANPRGTIEVALSSGTFTWDELVVDAPAHANGSFTLRGDSDVSLTHVTASAARAAYGPLVGTEATAQLQYADDRLTFDALRFRAAGGTWAHSGWFTLAEHGRFSGQLKVEGVQPHALAAMLGETEFEIPFASIDLDAELSGTATPDWKPHLRMTGSAFLSDGTIQSSAILRPIWDALVGHGLMRSRVDRPTRVQEVSATFTLRQALFDTQDLSLISDDYRVTGVGTIDMDGSLDLQTRIQLTSSGMQKMFLFAALPLPTGALPSLPPIPARVRGMIGDPVIRPDVAAIPGATAAWFVEAVLHTPRSVGGAVVQRLGHLWNGVTGVFGGGQHGGEP